MSNFAGFEWDEAECAKNLEKHGVDFRTAIRIFDGPVMIVPSDRNDEQTELSLEEAILRQDEELTDWERLKREEEAGIEPEPDPDEGDFDWSRAEVVMPPPKTAISIRLDDDVLEFFKSKGEGYQTRINAVLRIYMKANRKAGPDR